MRQERRRRRWALLASGCLLAVGMGAVGGDSVEARPTGPSVFCEVYPESTTCAGWMPTCESCHISTSPPLWNAFGIQLIVNMPADGSFEDRLRTTLGTWDRTQDSDGDGVPDVDEFEHNSNAGDPESFANAPGPPLGTEENPRYDVGNYDTEFAFRRVVLLYCGASPSWEDIQAFRAAADPSLEIHAKLDSCLGEAYWRKVALPRLADKRIRPIAAVAVLSDYNYDYNLWEYVLTDGRDARELLTADYHVEADPVTGELSVVTGVIPVTGMEGNNGQALDPSLRAGMITTQWFLLINTMFSAMPRTTAAHAYRSYLGMDIALSQGIWPAPGNLEDVDNKGITAPDCAVCHSTIEELTYPFVNYHGLTGATGQYDPNRSTNLFPAPVAETGTILGTPVNGLIEWANVAANSDHFARNLAGIFYKHALGRAPLPHEEAEFRALWETIPGDGYSADELIHRLVDTDAFGVP